MKSYKVYIGSSEQFVYTFRAKNLRECKIQVKKTWQAYDARWHKRECNGPDGSRRWYVKNNPNRPVLIIPD